MSNCKMRDCGLRGGEREWMQEEAPGKGGEGQITYFLRDVPSITQVGCAHVQHF